VDVGASLAVDVVAVPGVSMRLALMDERGDTVLERRGDKGQSLMVRNWVPVPAGDSAPAVGLATPATRYYLVISGTSSNPLDAYSVQLATRVVSARDEREPNDSEERAIPLVPSIPAVSDSAPADAPDDAAGSGQGSASGGIRSGRRTGILSPGDRDFYRWDSGEPVLFTVQVTPQAGIDVAVELRVAGRSVATADEVTLGGGEVLKDIRVQGPVTLAITGTGATGPEATYELAWIATPAPPMLDDLSTDPSTDPSMDPSTDPSMDRPVD